MIDVPVSWGELIDKITILEIKSERITDSAKLDNVRKELGLLRGKLGGLADRLDLTHLAADLKGVNARLWDIEDEIRACENGGDFGDRFVALARSVYITNDRRAELKREINVVLGSDLVEEKSYRAYKVH